jgi:hypothetical protein
VFRNSDAVAIRSKVIDPFSGVHGMLNFVRLSYAGGVEWLAAGVTIREGALRASPAG